MARVHTPAVLLALVLVGARARAEDTDAVTAEALFSLGRDAMARREYAEACAKFAESLRLAHAVGTLMNLAECHERRGALATARAMWREAADELDVTRDARATFARSHVDALSPRVPRLVLRKPRGERLEPVDVQRDGVAMGRAALDSALPVDPGEHVITWRYPGDPVRRISVVVAEGQTFEVELRPDEPRGPRDASPDRSRLGSVRATGIVLGGVGAAGLVVGAVTSALIVHDRSVVDEHCPRSRCDVDGLDAARRGDALLVPNAVAWIGGLSLLAGGLVLYLAGRPKGAAVAAAPAMRADAPATWGGTF